MGFWGCSRARSRAARATRTRVRESSTPRARPTGVVIAASTGGPDALRATKSLLNTLDGSEDLDILLEAAALSASVLSTEDAQNRLKSRRK